MHFSLPKSYDELAKYTVGLEKRLEQLEELVRHLRYGRFAAKSESLLHPGMRPLFDDKEESVSAEEVKKVIVKEHTKTISRKPFPDTLPREDVYQDLSAEEKICPCCHTEMAKTHEKSSEKLHVKPAEFLVKRFITPIYACKSCEQVKQARMPSHPIPKCSVTVESLAYIATAKYVDGLPLHRLEKIFNRAKVDLGRDKMSRWMIQLSEKLAPLKELLHKELLAGDLIAMDETTIQVLKEKGRRPDQKSYMIAQAKEGPPGRSITLFHYEKSRSAETIGRYLTDYKGSLVTDGLGVYFNHCQQTQGISHGGCWSHARRYFADVVKNKKNHVGIANEMLLLIQELFKIEKEIKGNSLDEIKSIREKKSKPVIVTIRGLLLSNIEAIPQKSLTGKALGYLNNQWNMLTRFLENPRLPIHNNFLEQQIRPFAVGRRAWLFADTVDGANASSIFYSLLNTAQLNGLNPQEYLCKVSQEIDSTQDLSTLLPFGPNQ